MEKRLMMLSTAVVNTVIVVGILIGNSLVIIAFVRFDRLRTVENYFIVGLSCVDLMFGFLVPVRDILDLGFFNSEKTRYPCIVATALLIAASNISLWTLMLVAIERYVKVFFPLHYPLYYTSGRVISMLCMSWLLIMLLHFSFVYQEQWHVGLRCMMINVYPKKMSDIALPMLTVIPLVITSFVYIRIFLLARRHARSIRGLQVLCQQVSATTTSASSSSSSSNPHETQSSFSSSDRKRIHMMVSVMGVLYASWVPFSICKVILEEHSLGQQEWDSQAVAYEFASKLVYCNSLLNPLIYHWKSQEFRRSFNAMLRCGGPPRNTEAWAAP